MSEFPKDELSTKPWPMFVTAPGMRSPLYLMQRAVWMHIGKKALLRVFASFRITLDGIGDTSERLAEFITSWIYISMRGLARVAFGGVGGNVFPLVPAVHRDGLSREWEFWWPMCAQICVTVGEYLYRFGAGREAVVPAVEKSEYYEDLFRAPVRRDQLLRILRLTAPMMDGLSARVWEMLIHEVLREDDWFAREMGGFLHCVDVPGDVRKAALQLV